jgi:hypothetical protein
MQVLMVPLLTQNPSQMECDIAIDDDANAYTTWLALEVL